MLLRQEHSHPVVTVMATVKAGLSSEGNYAGSGISHLAEHMTFKGTPNMQPGDIEKEVKSYGGATNAWTGLDSTGYYITVPKKHAKEAIGLMEDIIFNPALDPEELEKEKQVILKEIKLTRDDPSRRVMRNLWEASYLRHPYKKPVIGYESLFETLERKDLLVYHSRRYGPDNIVLTVVGDIEPEEALLWVKSAFGKHERRKNPDMAVPLEPEQNAPRMLKDFAEINLGYLAIGYRGTDLSGNDLYALEVLGILLGDWDGSRLKKRLVKEWELLYAVSAFNYAPRYPGLFIIYGVGDYRRLEEAKNEILSEIEKIIRYDIDEAELDAAKNMVLAGYINSLETTGSLARLISQGEILAGDPAFFEKYVDNVKGVNATDVKRVARKYLNPNKLTASYLYPDYAPEAEAGEKSAGKSARPAQRFVLPNGIRLILKEDSRIPKISAACAFSGGIRVETEENNGISNLTAAMLLKGTRKRLEERIRPALESRGGSISHFSGNNSLGLTLEFLSGDTEEALNILEDVIKNPTFPGDEIRKEKEKIYAAITAEDDDIYATGFLKLRKALFRGYPYGMRALGEIDSVKNISQDSLVDFHKKYCVAKNMVISLVGDFEAGKMKKEIEKRFSGMKGAAFELKAPGVPHLAGSREISSRMPREQSLTLVGFRGVTVESPDKYFLYILCSVLSGENGRLFESIRNKLGLSYAQGAFSAPGIDTGYMALYVATDKKHLEEAQDILRRELKSARKGAIPEEEIDLAKTSLIGRQKISLQTYRALAFKMALDELYGLGYDAYRRYPEFISAASAKDIARAAKKYIDLENFASVTISGVKNE